MQRLGPGWQRLSGESEHRSCTGWVYWSDLRQGPGCGADDCNGPGFGLVLARQDRDAAGCWQGVSDVDGGFLHGVASWRRREDEPTAPAPFTACQALRGSVTWSGIRVLMQQPAVIKRQTWRGAPVLSGRRSRGFWNS